MVRKLTIRETSEQKHEAVSRNRSTRSSGNKANSVGKFLDTQIERGKIDEKQVTVVYDKNNNIMWLGKAGFYPLFMSNIEYRSSGYDADHPHELWINARSYTTPFEESFKRNRVTRNRKNVSMRESGRYDYFDIPSKAFGVDGFDAIPGEPFTEEDEFNYYVDYIYDHAETPDDARRFLRSEGKSEDYINRVIAAVDAIYG